MQRYIAKNRTIEAMRIGSRELQWLIKEKGWDPDTTKLGDMYFRMAGGSESSLPYERFNRLFEPMHEVDSVVLEIRHKLATIKSVTFLDNTVKEIEDLLDLL